MNKEQLSSKLEAMKGPGLRLKKAITEHPASFFSAFLILLAVAAPVSFWLQFGQEPLSKEYEHWGQFGDYIGGLLNPLIACAALAWLIQSVWIQKKELRETRETLISTLNHYEAIKQIEDCKIYLMMIADDINKGMTHQSGIYIDREAGRLFGDAEGTDARGLTIARLLYQLKDDCTPHMLRDLRLKLDNLLQSHASSLVHAKGALEEWQRAHGDNQCFNADHYLRLFRLDAGMLHALHYLDKETFEFYEQRTLHQEKP